MIKSSAISKFIKQNKHLELGISTDASNGNLFSHKGKRIRSKKILGCQTNWGKFLSPGNPWPVSVMGQSSDLNVYLS